MIRLQWCVCSDTDSVRALLARRGCGLYEVERLTDERKRDSHNRHDA
jgi:hypothetical protein